MKITLVTGNWAKVAIAKEHLEPLGFEIDNEKMDTTEIQADSIEEDNGDINIYIGKESKLDDDVTIIKTKYKTSSDEGTIAIVGPKRMEYDRVVSMLEFIKDNIEG